MAGLLDFLRDEQAQRDMAANARNLLQATSNGVAAQVTAPVDLMAWGLRKLGYPIPDAPIGGTNWAKGVGLLGDVTPGASQIAGDVLGAVGPSILAAKAPEIAGGLLKMADNAMKPRTMNPQTGAIVWHGSPHKFDRFDSSKIGTGEGAQMYGHGLYFADAPDVAMKYQPRDSAVEAAILRKYNAAERAQQYPAMQVYEDFLLQRTPQEVAESIAQAGYSAKELAQAQAAHKAASQHYFKQKSAIYKVDLPDAQIAKMLDWDKPISQQGEAAQYLGRMVKNRIGPKAAQDPTGYQLYEALTPIKGGSIEASQFIKDSGIPGIRYLDGGSSGAGAGTYNYVVFPGNEDLLTILERNGQPVRGLLNP